MKKLLFLVSLVVFISMSCFADMELNYPHIPLTINSANITLNLPREILTVNYQASRATVNGVGIGSTIVTNNYQAGDVNVSGRVTANYFSGDGSALTGIPGTHIFPVHIDGQIWASDGTEMFDAYLNMRGFRPSITGNIIEVGARMYDSDTGANDPELVLYTDTGVIVTQDNIVSENWVINSISSAVTNGTVLKLRSNAGGSNNDGSGLNWYIKIESN